MKRFQKGLIISQMMLTILNCNGQATHHDYADHAATYQKSTADTSKRIRLIAVFENYFAIKDALVNTDGEAASTSALTLLTALNAVKKEELTSDERAAWSKVEKNLKFDAEHISETKDAGHQRDHFTTLSRDMAILMRASKTIDKVYLQHCPMFNGGKGADWLSKESTIKNPYYGSKMLSCGKTLGTMTPEK